MDTIASNQVDPPSVSSRFDPRRAGRVLLYTAIVTFCLAAVASIGVILFGDFGGTEGRILLSSFSIAAYSLAGLVATARFGRAPRAFAPLGLGSAGLGLALTLLLIWAGTESEGLARLTFSVMVLAGAFAHANLLLAQPDRRDPAAPILAATLIVSAILTALIVAPILFDSFPDGGAYWKALAALAVLLVLGTLVTPIVRKIGESTPPTPSGGTDVKPSAGASGDNWLVISYRGRVFLIAAEPGANDGSHFGVRALAMHRTDERPVDIFGEAEVAGEASSAFGHAVQELVRAIDEGRL